MRIEGIPEGWQLVRIGRPVEGESWINKSGEVVECVGGLFSPNYAIVKPVEPIETKSLSLDVSLEKVRALHRVWRALNDGDCPKCHKFHAATDIIRRTGVGAPNIQCPSCKFYIFMSEIEDIERLFAPAMDAAITIFEGWRAKGRVIE